MQPPDGPPLLPAPSRDLPEHRGILIALLGVALPIVTAVVELTARLCAQMYFDPFPTVGHIFVVLTVPAANILALWALWRRDGIPLQAVIFAQALALAVAGFYTLIFLPITPFALVAMAAFGLGLLPLTPLLSFWASWRALDALRRLPGALGHPPRQTVLAGLGAGLVVLVALQLPTAATRVLVAMAASENPSLRQTGLTGLRRFGQRELILRACYQRPGNHADLLSALVNAVAPTPPDQVREIYYRVTGRPFDTEPPPRLGRSADREEREWDVSQAGTEVGVVPLRGLSMTSSRLDGSIDARAALAYLEWTFELRNEAPLQREARAEVALPPGSVVSRVTLWIDGEEREAAFGGRDVTRRAYQQVVRAQRDPILVTTTAPDRILVQCFPVPPNGGVMKARLGITAPLYLPARDAGVLALPYLTQRNFALSGGHAVWVTSRDWLTSTVPGLARQVRAAGEEIRGTVAEPPRAGPLGAITVRRPPELETAWTADRLGPDPALIRQTLRPEPIPAPAALVVVIDGSEAMRAAVPELQTGLRVLPAGVPTELIIAGDQPRILPGTDLRGVELAGGADSVPALLLAWERAAQRPGALVLWIHGPQAMLLGPVEELRQRLERRDDGPRLHSYAAAGGENRLLATLADLPALRAVPRLSPGPGDLAAFLGRLGGQATRIVAVRERMPGRPAPPLDTTSDHLVRLWAHDRVLDLAQRQPESAAQRREAVTLASQYRLVTPVSGAVVLEQESQYRAAGLEPPGDGTPVPTVPEPETWALIGLVALVLVVALVKRRRSALFMGHAA